jgi:peroxiredoxin
MDNWKRIYYFFLHILAVGLILCVIFLIYKNRQLQSQPPLTPPTARLAAGDTLKEFDLLSLDGRVVAARHEAHALYFFFKTQCPLCQETLPIWMSLRDSLRNVPIFIAGVAFDSTSDVAEFVKSHSPGFPLFVLKQARSFALANRMYSVPVTILLSRDGTIEDLWAGALDSTQFVPILGRIRSGARR